MYCDFIGRAGMRFNQLPKWQATKRFMMPVVVRVSVGWGEYGAQHSQDWTSLVAHIPVLRYASCNALRCQGLMNAALQGTDRLFSLKVSNYDIGEHKGGVPKGYEIPIGEPDVKKEKHYFPYYRTHALPGTASRQGIRRNTA